MVVNFKGREYEINEPISFEELKNDVIEMKKPGIIAVVFNGKPKDLSDKVTEDGEIDFIDFASDEGKEIYWHSSAHIMAQAVQELYPETKVTIGPAIDNGFYYDFDRETPFTPEDLEKIEEKIKEILKRDYKFQRDVVTREEAIEMFKKMNENYKVEIISELPEGETISVYKQGDFVDLCRGPHVPSTSAVKEVKLLSVAGAYWRGDSDNKMLQRIYGISFPTRKELKKYLNFLEEAKRRDHRNIGKQLDLFSIQEKVGPGLVVWHPKGAMMRSIVEDFWKKEHIKADYQLIQTPHIGKSVLWETSGHLGFYNDSMYSKIEVDKGDYYLKPMNCPFHIMYYNNDTRSYRDLPMKLAELGTVYRYEHSGVLHGLLRVRGFTQDDAHIICTPEQMEEEVSKVIDFSLYMLKTFGFSDFYIYLSTMPEDHVGDVEKWEAAQEALKSSLIKRDIDFDIAEGDGAFYGPKIDINIKDALGRLWQCSTIQFDFNLPERFDMKYVDEDGKEKQPYMIHRALLGSIERFFGTLIEHYAGNFPVWLSPVQVKVITVTPDQSDYAKKIFDRLIDEDIRCEIDLRHEKIGYKIRNSEVNKIPYALIIGQKEVDADNISVRKHRKGDIGTMNVDEFVKMIKEEIKKKVTE